MSPAEEIDEFMDYLAKKTGWKEYYESISLEKDIKSIEKGIKDKLTKLVDSNE